MSKALCVVQLKLHPDQITANELDGQSKICNWLYNHLLEQANILKKRYCETQDNTIVKTLYTKRGLRNLIPGIKECHPFLHVVHSSPLKNAALRLSSVIQSYQNSRKGKRKGKPTGWPKFRSFKRSWFSLLFDEPKKGFKLINQKLIVSLGRGCDKKSRALVIPIEGGHVLKGKEIRTLEIIKEMGEYYAIFTVHRTLPERKTVKKMIALDPNHKNLAYGVDTEGKALEIESPWWLKRFDTQIDEVKSKRDKCKRKSKLVQVLDSHGEPTGKAHWVSSRRWQHYQNVLDGLYRKRREQTKTYLYSTSHQLVKRYDIVAIGDYTPHGGGLNKGMRRAMNNRSLIGRFKEILSWVAYKSGKYSLEINEKGSTRTCSHCDGVVEGGLSPSIRVWTCQDCKTTHIRDENAAINLLKQALEQNTLKSMAKAIPVPSSGHRFVKERCAWRVLPSGVLSATRGQNGGISTTPRNQNRCMVASDPSMIMNVLL